ncbi:MAG: hypothetical protein IKO48_03205 [Elusimicrobia bacterium]|nr:hypothetical protein [Elusimicrobiota bacterium]
MNKKIIKLLSFCLLCMMFFISCERYPVKALLGLSDPIDSWPDPWYIYDDEINTKGSLAPYRWEDEPTCADWNKAKLDFACTDNPKRGRKCVQLTWVGNVNDPGKYFFGFGLRAREWEGGTIDMSSSGYKSLKFYVRGTLYENCELCIEIPGFIEISSADEFTVTPSWQEVVFKIDSALMKSVEYDIAISLKTSGTTNGGTIYLDDIRFTKD